MPYGAQNELEFHLYSLLEIKRNEIQRRLTEPAKPLTAEELKAGGWWCADVSKNCANTFESKGLSVFNSCEWGLSETWIWCAMGYNGDVTRGFGVGGNKKIHRIGNDFYWSVK